MRIHKDYPSLIISAAYDSMHINTCQRYSKFSCRAFPYYIHGQLLTSQIRRSAMDIDRSFAITVLAALTMMVVVAATCRLRDLAKIMHFARKLAGLKRCRVLPQTKIENLRLKISIEAQRKVFNHSKPQELDCDGATGPSRVEFDGEDSGDVI